jgi:hypothetical protein
METLLSAIKALEKAKQELSRDNIKLSWEIVTVNKDTGGQTSLVDRTAPTGTFTHR